MPHGFNKRTMMNMMPIMTRIKSCSKRTKMNMMNTKMRIRMQAKCGWGGGFHGYKKRTIMNTTNITTKITKCDLGFMMNSSSRFPLILLLHAPHTKHDEE